MQTNVSQWLITNIEYNTINRLCTEIENRKKIEKVCASSCFRSGFSQLVPDPASGDHEIFILKDVWMRNMF